MPILRSLCEFVLEEKDGENKDTVREFRGVMILIFLREHQSPNRLTLSHI